MITASVLKEIFRILTNDEAFCRLIAYGKDPYDESKANIVGSSNHKELMEEIIRYSPQFDNIENNDRARMCIYKGFTKLKYGNSSVIQENIIIDVYVPHRLVREDMRIYEIENKIVALIDRLSVGIGYLDYVDGQFIQLPPISGYSQYKMVFTMQEGRPIYGRR